MEEMLYREIGDLLPGAVSSQMFGKPCYKVNGKAFICFFQNCMVFKLKGEAHTAAMALPGSILFDPSGKGRPMKEWVQVAFDHKTGWKGLAQAAFDYVSHGN